MHAGKGTVLSVDAGGGQVTMKDEARGNLVLLLTQETKVLDDAGNPVPAAKLKAGDLVREECVLVESSRCQAKQNRILQPAEKATASPSSSLRGSERANARPGRRHRSGRNFQKQWARFSPS